MHSSFKDRIIPLTSIKNGKDTELSPTVHGFVNQIVNVYFIENPHEKSWVLVDAGMTNSASEIQKAAKHLIGDHPPSCIILTHGHFDHVGSLIELVEAWKVPVYAHAQELPFLIGEKDYPEANTDAGGGLVTKLAAAFPNSGIDLSKHVKLLPLDHKLPHLPGWKWIHTPGHTPGHISLFHEADRLLIAGDAFTTVKQEALYQVLTQKKTFSGPPAYFTPDPEEAKRSIKKLADLTPLAAGTGHGMPVFGEELAEGMRELTED